MATEPDATTVLKPALKSSVRAWIEACCRAALRKDRHGKGVHALRLASRRASACLDFAAELLPSKRVKRTKRQLKRARRLAGPARDLAVLTGRLKDQSAASQELFHWLRRQERDAYDSLERGVKKLERKRFRRQWKRLPKKLAWRTAEQPEPSFRESAAKSLACGIEGLSKAGDQLAPQLASLHEFRIAVKRTRYLLELLEASEEDEQRARLNAFIVELQDRLGSVNDHAAAADLLRDLSHDVPQALVPDLSELIDREEAASQRACSTFWDWWRSAGRTEFQSVVRPAGPTSEDVA